MKGIIKKRTSGDVFNVLDDLFDIPKPKEKYRATKEELIEDFENYVKGV